MNNLTFQQQLRGLVSTKVISSTELSTIFVDKPAGIQRPGYLLQAHIREVDPMIFAGQPGKLAQLRRIGCDDEAPQLHCAPIFRGTLLRVGCNEG